MSDLEFDFVVVGAGIVGSWTAKELTKFGKVLLLEQVSNISFILFYLFILQFTVNEIFFTLRLQSFKKIRDGGILNFF